MHVLLKICLHCMLVLCEPDTDTKQTRPASIWDRFHVKIAKVTQAVPKQASLDVCMRLKRFQNAFAGPNILGLNQDHTGGSGESRPSGKWGA